MSRKRLDRYLRDLADGDADTRQQAAMHIMELYAKSPSSEEPDLPDEDAFNKLLNATFTTRGFPAQSIVRKLFERTLGAHREHQELCDRARETGNLDHALETGPFFHDGQLNMEWAVIPMVLEHCGQAALPLLPRLRELLSSSDLATRNTAAKMIEGLEASGKDSLDDLFEALYRHYGTYWPDPRARAIAEHAKRDEAVLDRVIAGLESDDDTVRDASCMVLTGVGPTGARAVPKLLELASRVDAPGLVAAALGEIGGGDAKVINVLLRILDDERNWIRSSAIRALGSLRAAPDRVVPALARFLDRWHPPWQDAKIEFDPDYDDFDDALEALAAYGESASEALPVLTKLFEEIDGEDYESRGRRFELEVTIAKLRCEPSPDPWPD